MQTFALADPSPDDSWDFVDDEDLLLSFSPDPRYGEPGPSRAARNLGPIPSAEEAEDATRLLRESLHEYVDVAPHSSLRTVHSPVAVPTPSAASLVVESAEREIAATTARMVAAARASNAHRRRAFVSHAMHLFSTDEGFQSVVRSLACDSAVWNAVNNNPEVRRLLSGPRLTSGVPAEPSATSPEVLSGEAVSGPAPHCKGDPSGVSLSARLGQLLHRVLDALSDLKASLFGALARVLGLSGGDSGEGESSRDEGQHLVPGIVVLVVLVLGIIVLKRPIII